MSEEPRNRPGIAVDSRGGAVVDPSENVSRLNEAGNKRQDDLREWMAKYLEAIGSIRSELQQERIRRIDDLRVTDTRRVDELRLAESRRVDEHAEMRAEYENKLAEAEKKRIDAIRAVDVAAVSIASERATQQATVLASQVATSADALRTLVATTAAATATQSQNVSAQFADRLALLERSQYETKGRSALADPQVAEMLAELRGLRTRASTETGKSAGVSMVGALVMGAITLVSLLLGVGVTVFEILGKR